MTYLPDFEVKSAHTIDEAVAIAEGKNCVFLGGGTGLLPNLRRGIGSPLTLVDISAVSEMTEISDSKTGLRIGASVNLEQLINHYQIQDDYKVIFQAAETIAGKTHRFSATVGGNLCLDTRCKFYNQSDWWRKSIDYCLKYKGTICHVALKGKICRAAFSGDLAPAMMLHRAKVELVSASGKRTIDLKDMYQEDGADSLLLNKGELVAAVIISKLDGYQTAYRKIRIRGGVDFPLMGVAMATLGDETHLEDIRIALTGTNSRPILITGVETLIGKSMDEVGLKELKNLILTQIIPMRSTFTPSSYRRKITDRVTSKLVIELLNS
jgi:4-hydroxybenzoyl-CoA reductase subunit beta